MTALEPKAQGQRGRDGQGQAPACSTAHQHLIHATRGQPSKAASAAASPLAGRTQGSAAYGRTH
eukprot:scaffold326683_cov53-Tisochrysis_lutea.AAC.1